MNFHNTEHIQIEMTNFFFLVLCLYSLCYLQPAQTVA